MREETVKVYTIEELSEEAQERAHYDWLSAGMYPWAEENRETLNEFENLFPVKNVDFEYGGGGSPPHINWRYQNDIDVDGLTGIRLMKYIINNYGHVLFKPRFIGSLRNPTKHKRTRPQLLDNGRYFTPYYSAIFKDTSCVLTGYFMDDVILAPIYHFLKCPDEHTSFEDILHDCLQEWVHACHKDVEQYESFESFVEESIANEWEYTEDGKLF